VRYVSTKDSSAVRARLGAVCSSQGTCPLLAKSSSGRIASEEEGNRITLVKQRQTDSPANFAVVSKSNISSSANRLLRVTLPRCSLCHRLSDNCEIPSSASDPVAETSALIFSASPSVLDTVIVSPYGTPLRSANSPKRLRTCRGCQTVSYFVAPGLMIVFGYLWRKSDNGPCRSDM